MIRLMHVFVVCLPFVPLLNVCNLLYCNANASVVCAIKITYLLTYCNGTVYVMLLA